MGFLFLVLRRMEPQLPRVNKDAANTFSLLCLKESEWKNVQRNGYLHTAADLNPSSMKTGMLCLPVIREETRVLCGLASKGKVIFVNKMRGNL